MATTLEQMRKEMFQAVRDHDRAISGIIQLILTAAKEREIEKGGPLNEEEVIAVLRAEAKKLSDSITQFRGAGRDDLADNAQIQLQYVEKFLPQLMSADQISEVVENVITESGASSMQDMGKVMGQVMSKLKGQADGNEVKRIVTQKLS